MLKRAVLITFAACAYVYDSRKRLVAVGGVKLEWDDRDRLIRSTVGQTNYAHTYDCK